MKFRYQNQIPARSQGQAIVEFAIVLPILMMMLVGILEVGRLVYTYAAIINASREAVRYASAVGRDDNGKTKYNYCAGIEERARRSAYFVPNRSVSIQYEFSGGATDTCIPDDGDGSDTGINVSSGDRVIVTVSGDYVALVRLIPIPSKTLTSSSARTILGILEMDAPSSGGSGGGGGGTPAATTLPGTLTAIALSNTPTATSTPTSTPTSTATSSGTWFTLTPSMTSTSTVTPLVDNTPTSTPMEKLTSTPETFTPTSTATGTVTATATPTGSTPICTAAAVTLTSSADTWIDQDSSSANNGTSTTLLVRSRTDKNTRILVQFTLPSLPSGCVIQSAKLSLFASASTNGRTLQVSQIASSWGENTATWSTANTISTTGSPVTTPSLNTGGWHEWTVTSLVQAMTSSNNFGFLIRDAIEDGSGGNNLLQQFASRESSTNKPQLVIIYTQAP